LVGLHVLSHRLTGNHYRELSYMICTKLLEDVPMAVRTRMWYLYDVTTAHFSRAVRDILNNTHPNRGIGRGGPIAWPPRSSDLNPLDSYLYGHLKALVCAAPVDNEESLYRRIVDACQTIHNYPSIFEWMRRSVMRRAEACPKFHGGHFEL
jgi:hypothetical protein